MGIRRYNASSDNVITNAFKSNLNDKGTLSNMGSSDVLETFVIHGQTSAAINAANAEETRILVQFPVADIQSDISNNLLPSQNVTYYLRLYNAQHAETLPENFNLDVKILSSSWSEGTGLDIDGYTDIGASNWISGSTGNAWTTPGGDYHSLVAANNFSASVNFLLGNENIELDVSTAVTNWLDGTKENYGFLIKHTDASITGSNGSLYTKKFFGRGSQYFFSRPTIEARWDDARQDNRGNFQLSSSMLSSADNLNTLYLYNNVKGVMKDIPGLTGDKLDVRIYSASNVDSIPIGSPLTLVDQLGASATSVVAGKLVENGVTHAGIYTASFAVDTTSSPLYDVWLTGSTEFHTGSFDATAHNTSETNVSVNHVSKLTNLKSSYTRQETPRLRIFTREENWSPTVFTVATAVVANKVMDNSHYSVTRLIDKHPAIPFGTGSVEYTKTSYDDSGNYFDIDMSLLEAGYAYGISLAYYLQGEYHEQPEVFKFRVEE
jgi:hypothetical protein